MKDVSFLGNNVNSRTEKFCSVNFSISITWETKVWKKNKI